MDPEHIVRPATEADLEAINDLYNDYVRDSHATFDREPITMAWRREWFGEHRTDRHRVFVALVYGTVAGYASSSRYRPKASYQRTVESSVYIARDHVGRGIGAALYGTLFDSLEGTGVHRVLAGITQPNEASAALHRRLGFRRVARFTEQGWKFERYWDVDWYERTMS